MADDAFIENEVAVGKRSVKNLKLPLNEDGTIDWENAAEKHKTAFLDAIEKDPNGILQNIQEEAGSTTTTSSNTSGIADATVLGAVNLVMVIEAIGLSVFPGPRFVPVLKNLHPIVAIKACSVTMTDIEPIKEPAARLIKEFVPSKYLNQKYQDMAICAEHLAKISGQKFKECIELAVEIQKKMNQQGTTVNGPNGNVVIEGQGKIQ